MDQVYLSRTNLITLLAKLDRRKAGEETTCSIVKHDNKHPKYSQSMGAIAITALEDEEYYIDRMPGPIHPSDMRWINSISNKYTAIYVESWMSGSHQHSITRMKRFTADSDETVMESALNNGIEPTTIVFLFKGWSKLQGEEYVPEL